MSVSLSLLLLAVHQCDDSKGHPLRMSRLGKYISYVMREEEAPLRSHSICGQSLYQGLHTASLPLLLLFRSCSLVGLTVEKPGETL